MIGSLDLTGRGPIRHGRLLSTPCQAGRLPSYLEHTGLTNAGLRCTLSRAMMLQSSRLGHAVLGLSIAAALGCGSSSTAPGGTGGMKVTIVAAEGRPAVMISGPNAYS